MAYNAVPNCCATTTFVQNDNEGATVCASPAGGSVDDAVAINAALATSLALGGGRVFLQRGAYRIKSRIDYPGNGLRLIGQGPGVTTLNFDDSAGLTDGVRIKNRYACSIENMTISATAARTAGVAISIQGGDAATLVNGVASAFHSIANIEMLNQCSGLEIIDSTGPIPTWGVSMNCRTNRWECTNGGTAILLNSTGGIHYLENVFITKKTAVTPLLYQVRILACKDANLSRITGTYGTDGIRIDPAASQEVTAINIRDCRFDTLTGTGVIIAPNALATFCREVDVVDSWTANVAAGMVVGGPAQSICFRGNQIYLAQGNPGIMIGQSTGPTGVNVDCNEVGGNSTAIYAANSVQDFQIRNNTVVLEYAVTPTVGVLIDAGCNHYVVAGNNLRRATTAITNTPGTSAGVREVYGNVTA